MIVNHIHTKVDTVTAKSPDDLNYYNSVEVFADSSYKLNTHLFDTANTSNDAHNNTAITFSRVENGKEIIVFRDSLFCMFPQIELQDINNDKVEDILVFHTTGARANPTYYLYLKDLENKKLIRIKGFEKLPNPDLDVENNVIVSCALAGKNYFSFYRIDENYKLKNLGFSYPENDNYPDQYSKAMDAIFKKYNNYSK